MPADIFNAIRDESSPPKYLNFDGHSWVRSPSEEYIEIKSPVDDSTVGFLPSATHEQIDNALRESAIAQRQWIKKPLNERVKIMHLAADWIRQYEEYFTSLMVMEIGKTYSESKSEISRTADLIDYFADEAISIRGETLDSDNFPGYEKGRIAVIERVPYGVVLAIAPFNYPVNLAASKIAPALLMGNSVVFKPPTQGGISGLHLTRVFEKAGVPPDVLCCFTGSGETVGNYLVSHPLVSMITFTGSSQTGSTIAEKAKMKPLLFECGGNNPAVVFPDANMKLTAREIAKGAFSYSGQRCTAIKYVLATDSVLENLIPEVQKAMEEHVHIGDPRSPHTKGVGPVVNEKTAGEIYSVIQEAVAGGAEIISGGKQNKAYVEPTLLRKVKPDMKIVRQEIFGPVLSFISVSTNQEAIDIINSSKYGLQACVFTNDEGSGLVFSSELDVGTVQINGSPQRGPDHFPFLGIKESGIGVQGVRHSLEAVSRPKPVVINKPA